jgi:glycosyltransferase involved in cell wall biosynthesis
MHWHEDEPGGLSRYMADLFLALQAAGSRPSALVLGPASGAPPGISSCSAYDRPLWERVWRYTLAARSMAATAADVVDAHFALYALLPVTATRLRRMPLVVHFQGPWAEESALAGEASRWRLAFKRGIERAVYRRAHRLIVLSTPFKRLLVERYGVPPWDVEVIPPGVDLERFAPGDREVARRALDLPPDRRFVLAVRRMVPRTGLDVLLRAWAEAAPRLGDSMLLLAGDGPERKVLEQMAEDLGIAGSVRFLGRVDDDGLLRCYHVAELSVVPSVALEGFGLVALESLACGTPVLATDSGGLPEALAPLDRRLVVPAGDAGALSARLEAALSGGQRLPDAARCRSYAATFGWPTVARRHREVYERAARPGAARMRVVYLDHCARLAGAELALLRLLPALDVDTHVVLGEDGPLVPRLEQAGVSVEVLPLSGTTSSLDRGKVRAGAVPLSALVGTASYVARLAHRLRRLQPDLVHTNSLKAALYGGVAARATGIPLVWHMHDRIASDYLPNAACHLVRAAAAVLPAAIIANSRATAATLGRAGRGAVVIPCALGFRPFPATAPGVEPDRPLRVGILGRLDSWKGQHLFLDAFAEAFDEGDEEAVVIGDRIFGDADYEASLHRQASSLGLQDRVEFRGFREPEEELRTLDVLAHASTIPEPFGQVVVEGMAAGLAVVAADAGGPAEVIRDGYDGLLYRVGDRTALAEALGRLAGDAELRHRLGDAARVRAEDFTPERVAAQVMDVYRGLATSRQ